MLIVCPSCASEYTIDATHVGPEGRTVRCAACRTTWRATPELDEAALPEAALPEPMEAVAVPEEPKRRAGWRQAAEPTRGAPLRRRVPLPAAAALALVALIGGALAGREAVVRHLPQAARLFAAVGLAVNLRGLALADVAASQTPGADGGVLVIEGDVVNPTRHAVRLPGILVEIRDGQDAKVYHWTTEAPRDALEPAERARFRARLAAPPAEGRTVLVRFADAAAQAPPVPQAPPLPEAPPPSKPGH